MSSSRRVLFGVSGLVAAAAGLWVAWTLIPGVHGCVSIACGDFESGGVDVFGRGNFTARQTWVMAAVIAVGGFTVMRAVLPSRSIWAAAGSSVLVLAVVASISVPSRVVAAAPTVACSTPGPDGPIPGACVVGTTRVDGRVGDRLLLAMVGVGALCVGIAADRKSRPRTRSPARSA